MRQLFRFADRHALALILAGGMCSVLAAVGASRSFGRLPTGDEAQLFPPDRALVEKILRLQNESIEPHGDSLGLGGISQRPKSHNLDGL